VTRALLAARHQLLHRVTPELCVAFVRAWAADLDDWRQFQASLPLGRSVASAFRYFGVGCVSTIQHKRVSWPLSLRRIA
jgi:hypothetical protein